MADDATLTISKAGVANVDVKLTKVSHNADKMLTIQPIPSDAVDDTKTLIVDLQFGKEAVTFNGVLQDVHTTAGDTWDLGFDKKVRLLKMFRGTPSLWTFTWGTGTLGALNSRKQEIKGVPAKFEVTEISGKVAAEKEGQIATSETSNRVFELMIVLIKTSAADILQA